MMWLQRLVRSLTLVSCLAFQSILARPQASTTSEPSCPSSLPFPPVCPSDYGFIGPTLEAVHASELPPTGLAVDPNLDLYLTYPRNAGPTPHNVVICTSYSTEEPWPNAAYQNCTSGQDASECFVNVQNVVLDLLNQLWIIDSGIPAGAKQPVANGPKIMSFNWQTRELLRTYLVPQDLYYGGLNLNDLRINNTLGTNGYAFIPEISVGSSLLTIDLDTGAVMRRLYNASVVRADEKYVGVYNGEAIYLWNGTQKSLQTVSADGIALQSGNVYWGVLASRRFYYIPQDTLIDPSLTDEQLLEAVVFPSQIGSEQAGFSADDKGRVYLTASEHQAIFYIDTWQSQVTKEVNGVQPGGTGFVAPEDYVIKTLLWNAQIQHADSLAILDGWLYFCTNQLALAPQRQYRNVERRVPPFNSYRVWIGAGPAV